MTTTRYAFTEIMLDQFTVRRTPQGTDITHIPCGETVATIITGTALCMVAAALADHICYRKEL